MLKYLTLALLAAGIYAWPSPDPIEDPETTQESFSESIASTVLAKAQSAIGVTVDELPMLGCSESAIPPEKVSVLLDALAPAQREVLASLLDASANVWTLQLYSGASGVGVCLPQANKLIAFPALAPSVVDQIRNLLPN